MSILPVFLSPQAGFGLSTHKAALNIGALTGRWGPLPSAQPFPWLVVADRRAAAAEVEALGWGGGGGRGGKGSQGKCSESHPGWWGHPRGAPSGSAAVPAPGEHPPGALLFPHPPATRSRMRGEGEVLLSL